MLPPDEVLIRTYAEAKLPADRVSTEARTRQAFIAHLPSQYHDTDAEAVAKRLLNLRRRGLLAKVGRKPNTTEE
jgi:hypothetical protein